MNKLFVRLLASGAIAASMGATVFADGGASINLTGPGSTNIVTSSNRNSFNQSFTNRLGLGNWNNQWASSGNVWVSGNTQVWGNGLGSGNAENSNFGQNNVNVSNMSATIPWNFGGGSMNGSIFLTGPNSNNVISSNNSNRFNSNVNNNISATNQSSQNARSGSFVVTGNTLVTGVGGSGNAVNENAGINTVNLANSSPSFASNGVGLNNTCSDGSISTTGPWSNNQIRCDNSTSTNLQTSNNVSTSNFNQQSAQSGGVTISGNTVVSGVGGSGAAFNSNMGQNDVGISNN